MHQLIHHPLYKEALTVIKTTDINYPLFFDMGYLIISSGKEKELEALKSKRIQEILIFGNYETNALIRKEKPLQFVPL